MTTYTQAKALADAALTAFLADDVKGKVVHDSTTTIYKNLYVGPQGNGHEVKVILKGVANDIVIVRHNGPETQRNVTDKTFAQLQAAAIKTLTGKPDRAVTLERIKIATTVEDLIFSPENLLADEQLALRIKCAAYSQARLDAFAASVGYDNINTLKAAKDSSIAQFAAEGRAGQAAWDAEWGAARTFEAACKAGTAQPTFDNYKAVLPASYAPVNYS